MNYIIYGQPLNKHRFWFTEALVFFWPPIKSFQRPDPQFHRRPARIVKKLISGNFARSEKWMENINALEISEDFFGNIWKFCTLWKIFRNIWKLYTLWKKSAGNIGGNNPNPALNMFVKIKLFYTLPLYHWIHIKTKKYEIIEMHIFWYQDIIWKE